MLSINGKCVEINNKEEMQEEKTAIKMHDGSRYIFFYDGFFTLLLIRYGKTSKKYLLVYFVFYGYFSYIGCKINLLLLE